MKPGSTITPLQTYTFKHPFLPKNRPIKGKKYICKAVFDDGSILIHGLVGLWNMKNFKVVKG